MEHRHRPTRGGLNPDHPAPSGATKELKVEEPDRPAAHARPRTPQPRQAPKNAEIPIRQSPTVDQGSDREDAALVNLRNQLLTGWYPASPLTIRVPELHNGIVQEHVAVVTVVNDRRWQETREHYRFFAAFDEADYLTISASYPGRPIPLPEGKSPFTVRTRHVGNSYSHDFIHHTPMKRGNSYDLAFKLVPEPDDDDPGLLTETSRAFHERTLTATLETIFIGERPRRIWSYARLSYFERPGQPKPSSLLDVTHSSSARASYRDLYGGLFNGIAWEW